jgi:hypothetical protein
MPDHLKPHEFTKGQPKVGGRAKGTRNKISEAFLKDLHEEWQRSGQATLKILAYEQPAAFAHLVAKVLPQAFDDEYPATLHIITGVPRHGEDYPQIPAATPALTATKSSVFGAGGLPVHEGDESEN